MSKYGRRKAAYFADGVVIECDRGCDLRRRVRERRVFEGYYGPVWFRFCPNWVISSGVPFDPVTCVYG